MAENSLREESLAYWSERASEYSALHMGEFESGKADAYSHELSDCLAELQPGSCVLDLGCGSGFMSMLLANMGFDVSGVDFSSDMIAEAKRNASSKGLRGITFYQMDVQDLLFADDSFDAVVSRNVTWVLEDVERVYGHVMRVMKPGGVFLNFDANYGKVFREQDEKGIIPTHVTQSLEQLRKRNFITGRLEISRVERPAWDVAQLWGKGASEITCRRFGGGDMFVLRACKPSQVMKTA